MVDMAHDDYKIGGMGGDDYRIGGMGGDQYEIGPGSRPTHGKFAQFYRFRKNGFKGAGLNDVTWGTGYSGGGSSGYFEVVIDGELAGGGGVDTFKWRKNGGAWTENVDITGLAQTLSDSQTILFAATTGHTLADQWTIGNLDTEPCTEDGADAQVTDATRRLLNPNTTRTWTDSGGKTLAVEDCTRGMATFTGPVGAVTVSGNNGFILESGLELAGYLMGWSLNVALDMADRSRCGQHWKENLPGLAGASGGADLYFIGEKSFLTELKDCADGDLKYVLLELFSFDPDLDQTGDHFLAWASITGINVNAPIGEVVKEPVQFQVQGIPSFVANT